MADGTQPCALARTDRTPLARAGLWEGWRDPAGEVLQTFTIATSSRCTSGQGACCGDGYGWGDDEIRS